MFRTTSLFHPLQAWYERGGLENGYDFIYNKFYSLGIYLAKAEYNPISVNYSSEGYGFVPEIGWGYDSNFLSLTLKVGYSFFNITDEEFISPWFNPRIIIICT